MEREARGQAEETSGRSAAPPPHPKRRRGRPSRARGQPNSSDDAAGRWTIRGVPAPVREMAVRRATERGMTVGDWVAEAIVGFVRASDKGRSDRTNLPATDAPAEMAHLLQQLDERISRLEEHQTSGFFGRLFGRRR